MKTIVLGAGIAGLAYLNNAHGNDIDLYEKADKAGGLCSSFCIQDFTFDCAVHLSFTKSEIVRNVFDQQEYIKHLPIAYNFYHDRWIKHPVINNLNSLDTDEKCELIESFVNREQLCKVNNYEDWLLGSYGRKFTERFYNVYTKKYWTMEAKDLSTEWMAAGDNKRLAAPSLHKMLYGAFEQNTDIDYYTKEMRYPKQGGYEQFLRFYMQHPRIHMRKEVVKIDTTRKRVCFKDRTEEAYDKLVSSLPLCERPELIEGTPDHIKMAAKRLLYSKISIVSIGFNKPNIPKYLWMYIYDEDIKTARINSPSIKSPDNAPKGCSSMQFEIYHRNNEIIDRQAIVDNVKYSLKKMKICNEGDIMFIDYRLLPYGNVIFYKGMEEDRKIVKDYVNNNGIEVIGRFGEWDYLWSDQSFLSGYNMAKKMRGKHEDE